jgi:hypothetical protein
VWSLAATCGSRDRANILNGYYLFVGTAWAVAANGTAYIAAEFP